jgi:hypothetical protein
MSIVKVLTDAMFLKEQWDVAILRAHKHVAFLIKKRGTSIVKIHRDVTVLREKKDMCIMRVLKLSGYWCKLRYFYSESTKR